MFQFDLLGSIDSEMGILYVETPFNVFLTIAEEAPMFSRIAPSNARTYVSDNNSSSFLLSGGETQDYGHYAFARSI